VADGTGLAEAGLDGAGTDRWAVGVAEEHPAAISTTAGTTIAGQIRTLASSHATNTGPRSSGIRDKLSTMTRPTARVLALLEILQTGGTHTVGSLAGRLEVDERTVRRYAGHLIDLDVPVYSVRGRYGGYRLMPGYRMPPLMLTDEEALAVLLGLVTSRRAGLGSASAAALESAAAKVRRVLPDQLGRRLDALLATTEFTAVARRPAVSPETGVLLQLAEAARDRRAAAITYTGGDGHRSQRAVQPYGIVAHSGRWYLTGADSASGQVRTFRLDRIEDVTVQPDTFEVPTGFDPAARVLAGLAGLPRRHEVSVRVQGPADELRSRLPASMAMVEPLPPDHADDHGPGWARVRLQAERLDWVPALLAGLDRPFVIESPHALRDQVRALAERLARYAETAG
jgi:predicted DNA-binding transcriptional regulator YafY